jgi:hypothetical protein
MPLPKVSQETDDAILHDMGQPGYVKNILQQIQRENPVVAGMIKGICSQYNQKIEDQNVIPVEAAITLAALIYRHLEFQIEAETLKKLCNLA